jgi:hypothetical protein
MADAAKFETWYMQQQFSHISHSLLTCLGMPASILMKSYKLAQLSQQQSTMNNSS